MESPRPLGRFKGVSGEGTGGAGEERVRADVAGRAGDGRADEERMENGWRVGGWRVNGG